MQPEEMKKGEVYVFEDAGFPNKRIIHRFGKFENGDVKTQRCDGYYISDMNEGYFHVLRKSTPSFRNRTIRKATFEESNWLNECIKQNKYISIEQIIIKDQIHEVW